MGGRYSSGGALPGALWLASIAQMENGSDGADSAGRSAGIAETHIIAQQGPGTALPL